MKCLKLIVACCTLVVWACGDATLQRGYGETPEELGRAIVAALNAKSAENLFHLRVDKDQYINELWPEFSSPGMTRDIDASPATLPALMPQTSAATGKLKVSRR